MMENQDMDAAAASSPVMEIPLGTIVYDAQGEKVGKVTFSTLHTGYFVVEKGGLFSHELYLPPTTIQARGEDVLHLNLTKDELKQDQWKEPPPENLRGAGHPLQDTPADMTPVDDEQMRLAPTDEERPLADEPILMPPEPEPPLGNR
jgi:hypothetical protein